MRRILGIQHFVVDGQLLEHTTASGGEWKPQIAAVDALVDPDGIKCDSALSIGAGEM